MGRPPVNIRSGWTSRSKQAGSRGPMSLPSSSNNYRIQPICAPHQPSHEPCLLHRWLLHLWLKSIADVHLVEYILWVLWITLDLTSHMPNIHPQVIDIVDVLIPPYRFKQPPKLDNRALLLDQFSQELIL